MPSERHLVPALGWERIRCFGAADGPHRKFVFSRPDCAAEATLTASLPWPQRVDISCSTMCGCPMGCRFCGVGKQFVRALSASEITGQAHFILQNGLGGMHPGDIAELNIRAFSMGEPLMNPALWPAFAQLHRWYPHATLHISTSAPAIDWHWVLQMGRALPCVQLQFSVHESTDAARDLLMPFRRKLNLQQIAEVGNAWHAATARRPSFHYCTHAGNVSDQDALRLQQLFAPRMWDASVAVIGASSAAARADFADRHAEAAAFARRLAACGFRVHSTYAQEREDLGVDCGQLWSVQDWMRENPQLVRASTGERIRARS